MPRMKRCPFCGGPAKLVVCDDEGNTHDEFYEDDPWSGLKYRISHTLADNMNGLKIPDNNTPACPITTASDECDDGIGSYLYRTPEEAARAWNMRVP